MPLLPVLPSVATEISAVTGRLRDVALAGEAGSARADSEARRVIPAPRSSVVLFMEVNVRMPCSGVMSTRYSFAGDRCDRHVAGAPSGQAVPMAAASWSRLLTPSLA